MARQAEVGDIFAEVWSSTFCQSFIFPIKLFCQLWKRMLMVMFLVKPLLMLFERTKRFSSNLEPLQVCWPYVFIHVAPGTSSYEPSIWHDHEEGLYIRNQLQRSNFDWLRQSNSLGSVSQKLGDAATSSPGKFERWRWRSEFPEWRWRVCPSTWHPNIPSGSKVNVIWSLLGFHLEPKK